jgi:carboxymethylenebutenolidase
MITQDVSFPAGKRNLNGYLARPDGVGPFPGILVIHEAYGLNENIKDITRRFAGQGYAALAVDLFANRNRVVCMFSIFVGIQSNSLKNGTVAELKSTLTYLAGVDGVDSARLGAVGYCMGGSLAIALACSDNRLKAIAPYYGMNPNPIESVKNLCPLIGSYPSEDFTASAGKKLDKAMDEYQIPHDIKIYPGAKHSFFNDTGRAYSPDAANDSWERVLAFFQEFVVLR